MKRVNFDSNFSKEKNDKKQNPKISNKSISFKKWKLLEYNCLSDDYKALYHSKNLNSDQKLTAITLRLNYLRERQGIIFGKVDYYL